MKTAEILGLEDIPVGVTNPQSADLARLAGRSTGSPGSR